MTPRDDVDDILQEWRAVRPDLDFAPLAVFSRLARIAKHLNRARARAFEHAELESWEFDVLAVLRRSGAPFRVSTKVLVQSTMVSSGTMTNRIDRLVARGFVDRMTDPNDGRGVLVAMTPTGRARVDSAITHLVRDERELLREMSEQDQAELAELLRSLAISIDPGGR